MKDNDLLRKLKFSCFLWFVLSFFIMFALINSLPENPDMNQGVFGKAEHVNLNKEVKLW